MERGVIATVAATQWDMTPYYMATLACDLFYAAKADNDKIRHRWYRYLLYCMIIEVGLKAVLLNNNNTHAQRSVNKEKIRHNLSLLLGNVSDRLPVKFFNVNERKAINKICLLFKDKDLEYSSVELIFQMASGAKGIPSIAILEAAAGKVVELLEAHKHFRGSQTTS